MARMRLSSIGITNPWIQAVLMGCGLFAVSLLVRAAANTLVGVMSAGPSEPELVVETGSALYKLTQIFILAVLLPAIVETPIIVWLVRRASPSGISLGLAGMISFIAATAWLLHGASPGSAGQAIAFSIMAYAAWAWGRRLGSLQAYLLPTLSHAVWNSIGFVLFAIN